MSINRLRFADVQRGLDLDQARKQRFFGKGLKDTSLEKQKNENKSDVGLPPEHDRLRLLAGLIYAQMAGTATIEEIGPGQLRVQAQGGTFRVSVGAEGRVLLSGFSQNPNLEQHVGKLKGENLERSVWSVVNNITTLITDSLDSADLPEPVYFPSNEVVNEIQGGMPGLPAPKTSIPSEEQGMDFEMPDDGASDVPPPPPPPTQDIGPNSTGIDPSMAGGDMMGGMPAPAPATPALGAPAPAPPPMPGFNLGPPTASKRLTATLDGLAEELEELGLTELAARVDAVTNTLEA